MNAVRRSDGRRQIGHEPTERRDREGSVPPRAAASAAHGLKLREIALREKAESTRVITRERNGWIDNAAPPARSSSLRPWNRFVLYALASGAREERVISQVRRRP